jgi:hypothetical protein
MVVYKPAAALIYYIGFSYLSTTSSNDPGGIGTMITGIMVLLLAVLAMPLMLRFFVWSGVQVAGERGGGAAMLGAVGAMSLSGCGRAGRRGHPGPVHGQRRPGSAGPSGTGGGAAAGVAGAALAAASGGAGSAGVRPWRGPVSRRFRRHRWRLVPGLRRRSGHRRRSRFAGRGGRHRQPRGGWGDRRRGCDGGGRGRDGWGNDRPAAARRPARVPGG